MPVSFPRLPTKWHDRPSRRHSTFRYTGLVTAMLAAAGFARAAAEPFQLPPIADPASQEHHTGKMILVQLVTPDLQAAERFYGGLFGWSFRDIQGARTPFAVASLDGRVVAGLAQRDIPAGEHHHPAWLSFMSVPDADATTQNATEHGAKVLVPPHTLPGRGREAILADPQGAPFGVLASSSGDPPDALSPAGGWIWRALITPDPVAGATFYSALFGFETMTLPAPPGEQHLLLASEHYARASVNRPPGDHPTVHPNWLEFVRVDSAPAAVAKATSLGGRVLLPPRPDRHGGLIAVVADPLGAPIGLMEWPEGQTKELSK